MYIPGLYCISYSRYVRALGAMYMRLVGTSLDVYNYLEPLLNDYRKLKVQNKMGGRPINNVLKVLQIFKYNLLKQYLLSICMISKSRMFFTLEPPALMHV